ncbi:MAG: polysaccharide pyruvyl transferase family protein [Deltaproteobacteria bacterium]|nr:polysaccharide pyruvyl transferase family protein [Deltaproteobacteria bacterium]
MKINLLTFHDALNYGAVWQAYALSRTLTNMGYSARIINLHSPWELSKNKSFNPIVRLRRQRFKRFLKHHLPPFTKEYFNSEGIEHDVPQGKVFVVGSDQVWNPSITKALMFDYFFEFVPDDVKKISYAASFGKKEIEWSQEQQTRIAFLLKRFYAVSVRENSGVKICRDIAGIPAVPVLDPVFLLSNSDYSSFCSNTSAKSNGLFCYKFDKGQGFIETVDYLSKALNMPAYIIDRFRMRHLWAMPICSIIDRFMGKRIKSITLPDPETWLGSLRQASFVFTDSFHGLAFSIIFQKNFIVVPANSKRFIRIEELLNELNLDDRIFYSYDEIRRDQRWKEAIDYNRVNKILSRKIDSSFDFLKNALQF